MTTKRDALLQLGWSDDLISAMLGKDADDNLGSARKRDWECFSFNDLPTLTVTIGSNNLVTVQSPKISFSQ